MEKQPESVTETVELRLITEDSSLQARVATDAKTVAEYAKAMADGSTFPPILLFFDGANYWVADGFHRIKAARDAGKKVVRAEVRHGDRRVAMLAAVGANGGLRRTQEDKRRAVSILLDDPEWSTWSDSEIARRCAVSRPLVADVRSGHLAELQDSHTKNEVDRLVSPTKRKALRGGVEYEVETGAIGRTKQPTPQRRVDESYADPVYQDDAEYVPPERPAAATPVPAPPPLPPPPPPPPAAATGGDPRDARIAELEAEVGALKAKVSALEAEADELDTKARKVAPPQVDVLGQPIPEDLRPIFAVYEEYRRQAHAHLQSLLKVGKKWVVVIRKEAERIGLDRAVLLREYSTLASAFESNSDAWAKVPRGAISMVAPSAICITCEGAGCEQCAKRGWFGGSNYVEFADRELVRLNRKPGLSKPGPSKESAA